MNGIHHEIRRHWDPPQTRTQAICAASSSIDNASLSAPIRLSVVLPVYNQADHIADVVADHYASLQSVAQPFEMILVSNGCRDESPRICRELAGRLAGVRAIDSVRGGWGLGVRLGLTASRGDWVCYTNSARTTGSQLMKIVTAALAFEPAVFKARRHNRSVVRGIGSLLYNLECRALFGMNWADVNGTPKMFPRSFTRLFELTRDDDLLDAEFSWVCRQADYPVIEIPTETSARHGGESTTKLKSAFHMYAGAFALWRHGLPIPRPSAVDQAVGGPQR